MSSAASTARPLGVVVAMAREARTVRHCLQRTGVTSGVALSCGGIGPDRARDAARALSGGGVRLLLSVGFAGGLYQGARAGHVLLPGTVVGEAGEVYPTWTSGCVHLRDVLAGRYPVHEQPLVSSSRVIANVHEKRALAASSGAAGVDMESVALAQVAMESGIPLLVIRAVSDTVEQSLPRAALRGVRPDGSESMGGVLAALGQRPWELPALLRLARGVRAAETSLDGVLGVAIPGLLDLLQQ